MTADVLVARVIATWFGCGYWPVGPGTAGSAAAVAIALVFAWSPLTLVIATAVLLVPATWAAHVEAKTSGRKDPGQVVVDEVAGQWLTLAGATALNWKSCLLAFLMFRALDIWKPPPARRLEGLPGGVGIMADDVMAGLYGALAVALAGWCNLY